MTSLRIFLLSCLTVAWMTSGPLWAQGYTVYNTGATVDGMFDAQGGICLMGGASENDEGMAWFLERAGGGDVLVLRASGSNGYNSYFFNDLGVNLHRVTTVVCQNNNASSAEEVLDLVHGAEAIWFAGGDQADYHNLWQGTPLNDAINHALATRNIAIGGTSAGMAILGGLRFTADNGTVYSDEALVDPYNSYMTLDQTPFLDVPLLAHTFTDTHFDNPEREGRLLAFMARASTDWGIAATAIACDEYTAVCIDPSGEARVFGESPQYEDNAYILTVQCDLDNPAPEVCAPGQPLTWNHGGAAVQVWRALGNAAGSPSYHLQGPVNANAGSWQRWWAEQGQWFSDVASPGECVFSETGPCTEDVDGDGVVGTSDVMLMLSEFGCASGCTLDLDADGVVGISDILAVLSRFGDTC